MRLSNKNQLETPEVGGGFHKKVTGELRRVVRWRDELEVFDCPVKPLCEQRHHKCLTWGKRTKTWTVRIQSLCSRSKQVLNFTLEIQLPEDRGGGGEQWGEGRSRAAGSKLREVRREGSAVMEDVVVRQ